MLALNASTPGRYNDLSNLYIQARVRVFQIVLKAFDAESSFEPLTEREVQKMIGSGF